MPWPSTLGALNATYQPAHRSPSTGCVFFACSDYDINKITDDEDTGVVSEPPDTLDVERCNAQKTAGEPLSPPGLGWTDSSICNATAGPTYGYMGVRTITSFEIYGTTTSPTPPDYVRLIAPLGGASFTYPSSQNYRSENTISATESGGDWSVDSNLLGNVNSCFPDCNFGPFVVEIQDSVRTAANECTDYVPRMEVCINYTEVSAARSEPVESSCSAGSGRFRLIPRRAINKDGDSNYSLILTPIQVTGTGRLTGAAWITDLDIVQDQGKTLRIIQPNVTFRFNETDHLVDKDENSIVLSATNDWTEGAISGGAPIIGEEFPGTTTVNFIADMEWTCGTVPVQGERHPSQGYVIDPADLDCIGSWKQQFTVRPVPYLAPTKLVLERYGHVEDRESIPLTSGVLGYSFDYTRGDFHVSGRLATYDAEGATLVIDDASVDEVSLCDPGTYSLPVEQ